MKSHTISVFKRAPITKDHVFKGTCIKCNPTMVPPRILQDYEHRNPRVKAPAVRVTRPTQATRRPTRPRIDPTRTRAIRDKNRLESYTRRDDRDIIPIVEIYRENLTKGDLPPLSIQDAKQLMQQSMEKEIWEETRPPEVVQPIAKMGGKIDPNVNSSTQINQNQRFRETPTPRIIWLTPHRRPMEPGKKEKGII